MLHINYKPLISLLPYIDRYWHCNSETEKEDGLFPLFVGTGVDLFIHFGAPFHIQKELLPSSHIFCPRQTMEITSGGQLNFLAVRFRCGAFRHFCSFNFNELNNRSLSVQDIWGIEGQELIDKLYEEQSSILRINILNVFLLKQFKIHNKETRRLDSSISYIYKNYEDIVISSLAKNLGVSLRHFERLFKDEFGISPKRFQVISRFQSTLKELLLSSDKDYLQVALNNGYYDQSHFIKECRFLSDMSPLEILNMKDRKSHFYLSEIHLIHFLNYKE